MNQPQGYCPTCSYPLDPGICPECGISVTLHNIRSQPKRIPYRLIVRLLLVTVISYGAYHAWSQIDVVKLAPTSLLLKMQAPHRKRITHALCERVMRNELRPDQIRRFYEQEIFVKVRFYSLGQMKIDDYLGHSPHDFRFVANTFRVDGKTYPLGRRWTSHGRCNSNSEFGTWHEFQGCGHARGSWFDDDDGLRITQGSHDIAIECEVMAYQHGDLYVGKPIVTWRQTFHEQIEVSN